MPISLQSTTLPVLSLFAPIVTMRELDKILRGATGKGSVIASVLTLVELALSVIERIIQHSFKDRLTQQKRQHTL